MFLRLSSVIEDWLLRSNIQLPSGPHQGGVAGWLTGNLAPSFVYPEITGYYLTWLTFGHARQSIAVDQGAARAHRALQWLCGQIQSGQRLPTRVYLSFPAEDWRNQACFAFDWAMVIRGAADARALVDVPEIDTLVSTGKQFLENCCTPGYDLKPCLPNNGHATLELLSRWSIRPGPYLLKAAAALRLVSGSALEGALDKTCSRLVSVWSNSWDRRPSLPELHSLFYSLEGLLLLGVCQPDRVHWKLAGEYFARVFEDGLNELRGVRSDVLAQALRIGSILMSHGCLPRAGWKERLEGIANALQHFVSSEGAVAFDELSGDDRPHWNAWSAMFACQAFIFWDTCLSGRSVEHGLVRLLV